MSRNCPTVRTVADNEQGYVVRNASDFDPEVHTLYEEPAAEAPLDAPIPMTPEATPAPAPAPVVTKFKKA